jgi:hypothetical protein
VVDPRVSSDPGAYAIEVGRRRFVDQIWPRPDDDRSRAGHGLAGVRRSVRVLEGELHPIVQPQVAATFDLRTGLEERIRSGHPRVGDPVGVGDRFEFGDVPLVDDLRQQLRSPHDAAA